MDVDWNITPTDLSRVRALMLAAEGGALVKDRIARNLAPVKLPVTRETFWHSLVGCLLTTQQRSGPTGAVARFQRLRPFPFTYHDCRHKQDLAVFVTETLSDFGGIRFTNKLGSQLDANLKKLEGGLWDEALRRANSLIPEGMQGQELEVAEFLDDELSGLGPKQSRHVLQELGLTRYEIPLDSRFIKWLNAFGFPVHLSATMLSDRYYYRFVSQGVQRLCTAAGIYPCVLDAAVFASFDAAPWDVSSVGAWRLDAGA